MSRIFIWSEGNSTVPSQELFHGRLAWVEDSGGAREQRILHYSFGWIPALEFFASWLLETERLHRGGD